MPLRVLVLSLFLLTLGMTSMICSPAGDGLSVDDDNQDIDTLLSDIFVATATTNTNTATIATTTTTTTTTTATIEEREVEPYRLVSNDFDVTFPDEELAFTCGFLKYGDDDGAALTWTYVSVEEVTTEGTVITENDREMSTTAFAADPSEDSYATRLSQNTTFDIRDTTNPESTVPFNGTQRFNLYNAVFKEDQTITFAGIKQTMRQGGFEHRFYLQDWVFTSGNALLVNVDLTFTPECGITTKSFDYNTTTNVVKSILVAGNEDQWTIRFATSYMADDQPQLMPQVRLSAYGATPDGGFSATLALVFNKFENHIEYNIYMNALSAEAETKGGSDDDDDDDNDTIKAITISVLVPLAFFLIFVVLTFGILISVLVKMGAQRIPEETDDDSDDSNSDV